MTQGLLNLYGTRESSRISNKERKSCGDDIKDKNMALAGLRKLCELLPEFQGFTASEVTRAILHYFGVDMCRNNVARSLTLLRNAGKVYENSYKKCPITGKSPVIAWRIA